MSKLNKEINREGEEETRISLQAETRLESKDKADKKNLKIKGTEGDDVLTGGDGNDHIDGRGGNDEIFGKDGNDHVDGGNGDDLLDGGNGNDNLRGEDGNDTIKGGKGNDKLDGGEGDDVIKGGMGNDKLEGGDGDDVLKGGKGKDKLDGGDGNDRLRGGEGKDDIDGGKGDDVIIWKAGHGNDKIDGGKGDDTFKLITSDQIAQTVHLDVNKKGHLVVSLDGGDEGAELELKDIENFKLKYGLAGATIELSDAAAEFLGDAPLDVSGGEGSDVIDASGSNQPVNIDAGTGDDVVTGGSAADTISGGEGSDVITGGGGDDVIDAGVGDDRVIWRSGDGNDTIDGGEGFDELDLTLDDSIQTHFTVSADADGNVILLGSDGTQLKVDGVEDIVFKAGAAGSTITVGDLTGTDIAQDTLYFVGGAGDDTFDASLTDRRIDARGNGGSDQLSGGSANDFLDGGAGDDVLNPGSGTGRDVVQGGSGDDLIRLSIGDDLNGGTADVIDGGADNDQLDLTFVKTSNYDLFYRIQSNGDGSFRVIGDDQGSFNDETADVYNVEFLNVIAGEGALNFELGYLGDTTLASSGVVFNGSAEDDFFNATNAGVSVDLRGGEGNNTLIGGDLADVLQGGSGSNSLQGNGGDDLLLASSGDDLIDGGTGFDTASYVNAAGAISLDLSIVGAQDTLGSGMDSLSNIERVEGSVFGDNLVGNALNNTLLGGDGDDVISGGDGFDVIFGGNGNDNLSDPGNLDPLSGDAGDDYIDGVASYARDPSAVIANFSGSDVTVASVTVNAKTVRDGYGDTDTLSANSTNLQGSWFADHVTGSDGNNGWYLRGGDDVAFGMDGNDLIMGGSGDDLIDGGAGIDTAHYLEDGFDTLGMPTLGVVVDLENETATDGFGDTDTLLNIESVNGSNLSDNISGDGESNTLRGHAGADVIHGAAGDDVIQGGADDDTLSGGLGADRFEFTVGGGFGLPQFGNDTISDFDVSADSLDLTPFDSLSNLSDVQAIASDNGSDTTIDIAGAGTITLQGMLVADLVSSNFLFGSPSGGPIVGTENDDSLDGTSGNDIIQGLGGNDILRGLDGDDQLEGGSGDDRLRGMAGEDYLVGGDGLDAADYSEDIAGVTIDLALQIAEDGWGDSDFFSGIENAYGSDYADIINGDAATNFIWAGDGDDIINTNGGADQVWGDGGNDTITAAPTGGGLVWLRGGAGNDIITGSSSGGGIEILLGEEGDDTLSDPAGVFSVLNGGPGNDYINGFASYLGSPSGVIVNYSNSVWDVAGESLAPRTAIDSWGDIDTFGPAAIRLRTTDFDDLVQGSDFGQRIDTLAGDDVIYALGGDDQIFAGPGSDIIWGGAGGDNLHYGIVSSSVGDAVHGVVVNLGSTDFSYGSHVPGIAAGTILANTALDQWDDPLGARGIDKVYEIEFVSGTDFGDVIVGDTGHNYLDGRGGDDQIYGGDIESDNLVGGPGNDYLDGQGGDNDTAWYRTWDGSGGGVIVDLSSNFTAEDGFGGQDVLVNIENVEGSAYDDDISGDSGRNFLRGNDGDDTIFGDAGDDGINGDGGNDVIDGGDGNDFIDASPGLDKTDGGADWDIYNFNPNVGTTQRAVVDMSAAPDAQGYVLVSENGFGGTGLIKNFEGLWGTDYNDEFTGDDNDNELQGFVGADTLLGMGGNDRLYGGDDDDVLEGGSGNDVLDGGENNDLLRGGSGSDRFSFVREMYDGSLVTLGEDVVEDFNIGEDILDVFHIPQFTGLDALLAASTDVGNDVVISFETNDLGPTETNSITLRNVSTSDFQNMQIWFSSIRGTEGDDTLNGTEFGERIEGFGGNDVLNGFGGNDRLEGGDGDDVLHGGSGQDDFLDGHGNDEVYGGPDSDFINASPGNDIFDGGDGHDTVSYRWWHEPSAGITVDLSLPSNQVINDGWGGTDTLIDIEGINGSPSADTITGSAGNDSLIGEAGDDVISAGAGGDYVIGGSGNDTLDGGADWDVLAFPEWSGVNQGVIVDLESNVVTNDGFGSQDSVFGFERVDGSQFGDSIHGDAQNNHLLGHGGDDTLSGGGGFDTLEGGPGNDIFKLSDGDNIQIPDFVAGPGSEDAIDLQSVASLNDFAGVQAAATDDGSGNVNIDTGLGSLHLVGVSASNLHADDFIF